MAASWYTTGLKECLDGTIDLVNDTIKLMLVKDGYDLVFDSDQTFVDDGGANDPLSYECDATGYTGGHGGADRLDPTTIAVHANLTDDRVDIVISDVTWPAIGGASNNDLCGAVLYKEGASADTTARLIAYFEFTSVITTNGGDIQADFNDQAGGGNLRITVPQA